MPWRAGVECGQSWWRKRSWSRRGRFRKFPNGFAVGPLMFWKEVR